MDLHGMNNIMNVGNCIITNSYGGCNELESGCAMRNRNTYKVWMWKSMEVRPPGTPSTRCKNKIKTCCRKIKIWRWEFVWTGWAVQTSSVLMTV